MSLQGQAGPRMHDISPEPVAHLSQHRLLPMLLACALENAVNSRVLFDRTVLEINQPADHVSIVMRTSKVSREPAVTCLSSQTIMRGSTKSEQSFSHPSILVPAAFLYKQARRLASFQHTLCCNASGHTGCFSVTCWCAAPGQKRDCTLQVCCGCGWRQQPSEGHAWHPPAGPVRHAAPGQHPLHCASTEEQPARPRGHVVLCIQP